MLIANPTYDTTFKYLMDDQRSARIILGALLGKEVIDVRPINNDIVKVESNSSRLLRLDFAANIRETDADGNVHEFTTTIELQKALSVGEVARFRKYLGHIYLSDTMAMDADAESMHIVTIYILGHCVDNLTDDITYISPTYLDRNKQRIEPQPKSEFVEKLVHETIIVQIPKLTLRKQSRLDKALSIFKVSEGDEHKHFVNVEEIPNDDDMKHVLNVLSKAIGNEKLIQKLEMEEELLAILQNRDESVLKLQQATIENAKVKAEFAKAKEEKEQAEKAQAQAEKEKAQAEKEKELAEKEKVHAEKAQAQAEKEKEMAEKEKAQAEKALQDALRLSVTALRSAGMTDEAIASTLNISMETVKCL